MTVEALNRNCVLRRNVKTQPYGRCTICTLQLSGCHAWQSNAFSFFVIVLALSSLLAPSGWLQAVCIAALLVTVVVQGMVDHKRTDELIDGAHKLQQLSAGLETQVSDRTAELRASNRALAATNLELLELDRAREGLLANVSHELRTPLTSIRGAAQNLGDGVIGALAEAQRDYVSIIEQESRRLLKVVEDVLEATRPDRGRGRLARAEVDLRAVCAGTASSLRALAEERQVAIHVDGEPLTVSADADKVRRIVDALTENALKFTDSGGTIDLRVVPRGAAAAIEVTDTGIGIDDDDLPHLFERFFRAKSGGERPGTGLGLAIARNLARLHGGDVEARSRRGAGSTFTLVLPRDAPRPIGRSLPILADS